MNKDKQLGLANVALTFGLLNRIERLKQGKPFFEPIDVPELYRVEAIATMKLGGIKDIDSRLKSMEQIRNNIIRFNQMIKEVKYE